MIFEVIKGIILGIIEGITEWLPISSTGHMIIFDELFSLSGGDAFKEMFFVVIQFGAILAVLNSYKSSLIPPPNDREKRKKIYSRWCRIIVASFPAAFMGLLFDDSISQLIIGKNRVLIVATTLIFYGFLFLEIEKRKKGDSGDSETEIDLKTAFFIGVFQALAIVPGTSRSGATIIGAMLLGVSRKAATEFSFFLALPAMLGATGIKGAKFIFSGNVMDKTEWAVLIVGCIVSYVVSVLTIKYFISYVKKHSFVLFGYYRVILGMVLLAIFGRS